MNPLRRKLHLASGIWSWAANGNYISIRDPRLAMTWKVSLDDIKGGTRAATPALVKGYIERHLLRPVT